MPLSGVALLAGALIGIADCEPVEAEWGDHLLSVCDKNFNGEPTYSATVRASLRSPPASQQVLLYRLDGEWFVRIAGYSDKDGAISTRRTDVPVTEAEAQSFIRLLTPATFERLSRLEYYGEKNIVCTDGSNYELAFAQGGRTVSALQHSCAGNSELFEIVARFRKLAIAHDRKSRGMLYWLGRERH